MYNYEYGVPEEDQREIMLLEDYEEYKQENCTCFVNEDCCCLSLDAFADKRWKECHDFWITEENPQETGEIA